LQADAYNAIGGWYHLRFACALADRLSAHGTHSSGIGRIHQTACFAFHDLSESPARFVELGNAIHVLT